MQALGFCDSPSLLTLYAHRGNGTKRWFSLVDGEPVEAREAIVCYIKAIEFPEVERRNKECRKLHIKIKAHRSILIESGYNSNFSKGFLLAIASLTPEQLKQQITIEADPGKEESVLFCKIWLAGQRIFVKTESVHDWRAIAEKAIANVRAAQGVRA
ncbi:hypothetical protein C1752_16674 [Acaryochloris thomasi RCC1774]|uniref:Uncharacterized protein n=1 Tax=Acaryochloris thomasi RCC1774 TaxID=1764569 RepID=A0A2W1J6M1_9CYAN|nr:hypothetical protein [Acaryochloris thomasi]PZD70210.1 hypothetical protein C1752_16674 [Acaryochloris thomasi RCC1774]